jgi:hypothetical protein
MEGGAADRRHRLGAGERVDAAAADVVHWGESIPRSTRPAQTVEQSGGQRGLAACIAQGDGIAQRKFLTPLVVMAVTSCDFSASLVG